MESGFRSTDWQQLTFAVVGMGLIGGSYAKALRRLGVKKIIGVDTDGEVLLQAQEQALIDEAVLKAGAELKAADVVICSVYPAATLGFVKSAVPFLKSDVLITDATGIKGSLPEDVQRLLTGRMEFIAGHPMAGRQGSGLGMSQAEIFDGANYIVVPAAFNSSEAIAWLSSFAYAIGCGQVVRVDADEHDRIIAYTSNLPHALAVALINSASYNENTKYFINPTGRFVIGGPQGDAGLTGRKIIVDTYGGYGRHGGGAFSGKDPTKVDRSAAYAARYVAKNIVAAGLADKCEVQLAYAIGVAEPVSVFVDTFGTGKVADDKIAELVRKHFDLRPAAIIKNLDLRKPIYKQVAAYGHFGRNDLDLPWEKTDVAEKLKAEA